MGLKQQYRGHQNGDHDRPELGRGDPQDLQRAHRRLADAVCQTTGKLAAHVTVGMVL